MPGPHPADTIVISCVRAANNNQTVTVTIPNPLVLVLDWIAANVGGGQAYTDALNVMYEDILIKLLPQWQAVYTQGQIAPLQTQITTTTNTIQATVAAALAAIVVTGQS